MWASASAILVGRLSVEPVASGGIRAAEGKFRRNHGEGRGRAACRRPTRGRRVCTPRGAGGRVKGGPEGRSEGPRNALDADGERRGISRLAARTAGPRTGAGSRPRRRRRGRSRLCELSRRSRTAYRVCRSGLRSCLGCCCLLVRSCCGLGSLLSSPCLLVVLLVLARPQVLVVLPVGWPVSFALRSRRLTWAKPRPWPGAGAERW